MSCLSVTVSVTIQISILVSNWTTNPDGTTIAILKLIQAAAEEYHDKNGMYPTDDGASTWFFKLLWGNESPGAEYLRQYVARVPERVLSDLDPTLRSMPHDVVALDAYNNRIVCHVSPKSFCVYSCGRDGIDDKGLGDDLTVIDNVSSDSNVTALIIIVVACAMLVLIACKWIFRHVATKLTGIIH